MDALREALIGKRRQRVPILGDKGGVPFDLARLHISIEFWCSLPRNTISSIHRGVSNDLSSDFRTGVVREIRPPDDRLETEQASGHPMTGLAVIDIAQTEQ